MSKADRQEEMAEARHNELIATIIGVIGAVVVGVGYILDQITRIGWAGFLPYEYRPYHDVAIGLWTLGGIMLFVAGAVYVYYYEKRQKLLKESKESKGE